MTPAPSRRPARPGPPSRRELLGLGAGIAVAGTGLCCAASTPMPDTSPAPPAATPADELLAGLLDQSARFAPITVDERAARVRRLGRLLDAARLDALLVEPGTTLSYLTGLEWGLSERLFALVVFADGSTMWICPAFEVERAEREIARVHGPARGIEGWQEDEHAFAPLASALVRRGVQRLALEPRARVFVWTGLAAELGAETLVPGDPIVEELRGVKDEHELALLRGASELTQQALATVAERLPAGWTDREIGALVCRAQERLGLRAPWVLPLVGEDAAVPHGAPTGRELRRGDSILLDTGGSLHGYQSDTTRSWVFDGSPPREFTRAWNTVRDAQRVGFEALRPGARCRDADRAARAVIEAAGYGAGYAALYHRLGHGIGMDGHEAPYLDGGSSARLAPGMTFTAEPGIYRRGEFGLRLEDVVVVTAGGADHFGAWASDPRSPA
ncbi:MAG: Xaa-Pro peptidase family protein [Planctomycetota bacterium]